MYKSFLMWLEDRVGDNHFRNKLLKRLGFSNPENIDPSTIKLADQPTNHLKQVLGTLGLDEETVDNIRRFVDSNKGATLQQVLNQLEAPDITSSDTEELPSQPAELPKGQDKPVIPQQPPQTGNLMGQYGQTFGK